jgi:hypothetical protein
VERGFSIQTECHRKVSIVSGDKSPEFELKQAIDTYIDKMSEGHRLHRKVKFLLDIRGLLVINKIQGDYVEFGVYQGEMMYAAAKILSPHIRKYIGLDTFTGLPEPRGNDAEIFVFESQGFKAAPREVAETMMSGFDSTLMEGDFRRKKVQEKFKGEVSKISVLTIDCNWPSSVRAALLVSYPFLQSGSIVFIDDYFVATRQANFNDKILHEITQQSSLRFREFMTYPPCARAFLVEA